MNRRDFLASAVAAAALPVTVRSFASAPQRIGTVKFCAFADMHYCPGVWPNPDADRLDAILDRAKKEKSAFVIQLGDFVHRFDRREELDYVKRYRAFSLPTYSVLGNHDGERGSGGYRKAVETYGMKGNHYHFDVNGWRFIVGDHNYFRTLDGSYFHYDGRNLADAIRAKKLKSACALPPEEVEWIRRTVEESPYPCVYFSHQSLERPGVVANGAEVRRIFESANRVSPGKVRLVINGHHHCDHVRVLNGIVYLDLNSANYFYYPKKHSGFPAEYVKAQPGAAHTVVWRDPLSAVVTVSPRAIRIKGSRSVFHLGVTPESVGFSPVDGHGRLIAPMVSDFEMES
jgi:predicted phosphodiesterase